MVVTGGSGWVRRKDGTRENLTATSVVIWEPGEWVEYGSNIGEGLKTDSDSFLACLGATLGATRMNDLVVLRTDVNNGKRQARGRGLI